MSDVDDPPSPGSYWFPLLLIVLLCGGYLYWRRSQKFERGGYGLNRLGSRPAPVRLSLDDDGPPTHSFISNNASTDSLPAQILTDIPTFPQASHLQSSHPLDAPSHPAHQIQSTSPVPSYTPPSRVGSAMRAGRRSDRGKGPVEGDERDDTGSSESEAEVEQGRLGGSVRKEDPLFGIGDDDDDT